MNDLAYILINQAAELEQRVSALLTEEPDLTHDDAHDIIECQMIKELRARRAS